MDGRLGNILCEFGRCMVHAGPGTRRENSLERSRPYLHDPTLCAISCHVSPRIRIPGHAFNPSKHATDSQPFPRSWDQNSAKFEKRSRVKRNSAR